MSSLSYALFHTSKKISSKASDHLTSSFTTDKFIGMELFTTQSEKTAGYNKKLQNRTQVTRNSRELDYPDSWWRISGNFMFLKSDF
jgi:hypothetical protein